ncbi:hypothetical protein H5410_008479 [Solanum commersonii]|uniref:Uncharacterized protein n=1 Tax=Solanum commersonii TaxID=4109 RepID=A0A9J6AF30_SOLCO|nr:hypothetical protein H5410_008479 [Solanum commersonii]
MASIYSCKECNTNFNLHTNYLFPSDFYFEAGNKGTLSFSAVDPSKFKFEKEDKIRPFFETLDYWGIQRKRTKMMCMNCGKVVGYVYDDGPPMTDSPGQFHFGPSQRSGSIAYSLDIYSRISESLPGSFSQGFSSIIASVAQLRKIF